MSRQSEIITVQIDNQELRVESGLSILQAAEQNDIYIPTLCAHKDLTPFGGCRMCIVEVEGMRGFPTSCTTPVTPGMIIRTNTAQIQTVRNEILQLILSEHPSSCLICDENAECKKFMGTIRKSGVITGCHYCPNDDQCELQKVVEKMGVTEVIYPIYYRNLKVEKNDPFYDRDYNLCILCGRCIRMCQEIRIANTLAFKQRGRHTVIGPAFDRTHLESGCEFCGACVSVCPTGALYDKTSKWDGKADHEVITTCAFCGVGCQMRLLVKNDQVIGALPAEDKLINKGQLCVKGRYGVPELVNNYHRLRKAYKIESETKMEISREAAIALAAAILESCSPDEFGLMISPNCTNEDLYIAQKFARVVMKSHNIDTSARLFYRDILAPYIDLMKMTKPISSMEKADTILCVGLDTQYGRSVIGVAIRRAAKRGAKIITIHPRNHNLVLLADNWLKPESGAELHLMITLAELTGTLAGSKTYSEFFPKDVFDEITRVALTLKESESAVILVGPEFINLKDSRRLFESLVVLAQNIGAGVLPLPGYNNLFGSLVMGAYSGILPGGGDSVNRDSLDFVYGKWGATRPEKMAANEMVLRSGKSSSDDLKVLYLIGEVPLTHRPNCDYLIYQNIFPPPVSMNADLVIPAAAFTETDGTFINGEGRIQQLRKTVSPAGDSLADWEIICRIAQKMGKKGFNYTEVSEIQSEIAELIPAFAEVNSPTRRPIQLICENMESGFGGKSELSTTTDDAFYFALNTTIVEHAYKGFSLSDYVEGMRTIFPDHLVDINPDDASKLSISNGDKVAIKSAVSDYSGIAKINKDQPPGVLRVALRLSETSRLNPIPVNIRKSDV